MAWMRAGLTTETYDRGYTNRELLARLAGYFRPQGRRLLVVMTLVSLMSLTGALLPVLMAQGVNVVGGVAGNREAIAALLVALVLVAEEDVLVAPGFNRMRMHARAPLPAPCF